GPQRLVHRLFALPEPAQVLGQRVDALLEHLALTVGALQHIGDAHSEILDARRVIAAQALAELLLADVERRQGKRGIRHVLGPNRTVPNRITVAPSRAAEA